MEIPERRTLETEGESREEFLDAFNDANNRVLLLSVTDLDPSLLPPNFQFFNPRAEFNEVYGQGFPITAANTRRVEMEASEAGDLRLSPDAKGYIQTARQPQVLRVVSKVTNQERTLQGLKDLKLELTLEVTHDGQIQPESIIAAAGELMAQQGRQAGSRARQRRAQSGSAATQTSLFELEAPDDANERT